MRMHNEKGFTLIELFIVVAIIAALAAIAIPQFSKYRSRAYDDVAIAELRNAETCQEAYFSDNHVYTQQVSILSANYNLPHDPNEVDFLISSADDKSYSMSASHKKGTVIYGISGPGGAILSTPKP